MPSDITRIARFLRQFLPFQGKTRATGKLPPGMSRGAEDMAIDFGPVRVLSATPPVFLTGIPYNEYLGIARAFAAAFGNMPAGFIVFPTWSIESQGFPEAIAAAHASHASEYPGHRFHFICNTRRETELLQGVGLWATFLNKNFTVSDEIFHPISGVEPDLDAVYNARLMREKRQELAAEVDAVGYIAYLDQERVRRKESRRIWSEIQERTPRHVILNGLNRGLPVRLGHSQVNEALARGAVGLLLSRVEGSSYASMEYMLAGLPVVSTHSIGGRDVYFDPEYCIVCDPDPRAVRDAVAALKARGIPRDVVRAKTLAKIEPERQRLLALADDLREQLGAKRLNRTRWPFGEISGVPWDKNAKHLATWQMQCDAVAMAAEVGLGEDALDSVQLTAAEIRPILSAIRERSPGCRLLVFGCGHDARLWSEANRSGTTVFLEDQPQWAELTRRQVPSSRVFDVHYTTRVADARSVLAGEPFPAMQLPAEVASRRWDVILVDGPAGYKDEQPGRMQSIEAASRLIAPGGIVFVHDSERAPETASAARFLARAEVVVEAKGRALLRGYRVRDTAV